MKLISISDLIDIFIDIERQKLRNETLSNDCLKNRKWHIFLASIGITFFFGIFFTITLKILYFAIKKLILSRQRKSDNDNDYGRQSGRQSEHMRLGTLIKIRTQLFISGQTLNGRIMVNIDFCLYFFEKMTFFLFFIIRLRHHVF